jgi:hypothetical protein
MNLVQINERLKDLPMQVIQQYANGMNPEVPPYLALGELQRREIAQKQMATAQGAQQGPQPSVKEQVEQKAGLMAAQGLQQQQAMQQMAQQGAPGPVPAGVPQPEMQPQPEAQPTMMARGGLAGAPVNFNFQHGGIVAFEEGGKASKYETSYDRMNRKNRGELTEEEQKKRDMIEALIAQIPTDKNTVEGGERVSGSELGRNISNTAMALPGASAARALSGSLGAGRGVAAGLAALPDRGAQTPQMPQAARPTAPAPDNRRLLNQADAATRSAPATPAAPIADLKALAEQKQRQQGPRPAAAAPQAAPVSQESELSRLAMEAMRNPAKAMTPEQAMAQEGKMAAGYGLDKPFGEEERGLLAAMKQRQAQQAAGRPSAELGAVLRGFGQGYGGAGAAGERASQETFNADMAHQREMLNAINALNKTNLDTGKERYKTSGNLFGKDQELTAAANRERAQSLGQMSTAEANRKTQERGQDMQLQAAKIQAAASREAREMGADDKTIAAAEAAFARDPEAAAIKKRLESPIATVNPAKAQVDIDRLRAIQASKYQQFGIKLEGAPGAAGPGGTTRMRFDAQGNPIK